MSSLHHRTAYAYQWIEKYLEDIPVERWDEIPENLDTNISWQLGHLTLSAYYHSIMVIVGHQPDLLTNFPLAEYSKLFHRTKAREVVNSIKPATMLAHWELVTKRSLETINQLSETEFPKPLVEHPYPHPIATNKEEALEWNVLHNHYHWGQIGLIRRVLLNDSFNYWQADRKSQ